MTKYEALERAAEWAGAMKRICSAGCRNAEAMPGAEEDFLMWDEMKKIYQDMMREIRYGTGSGKPGLTIVR